MSADIPSTPSQINFGFDKDQIILYKLGIIEAKLDTALASALLHQQQDDKVHTDQENRIKSLEAGKAKVVGGLAVFTVGFNAAYAFLHSKGLL